MLAKRIGVRYIYRRMISARPPSFPLSLPYPVSPPGSSFLCRQLLLVRGMGAIWRIGQSLLRLRLLNAPSFSRRLWVVALPFVVTLWLLFSLCVTRFVSLCSFPLSRSLSARAWFKLLLSVVFVVFVVTRIFRAERSRLLRESPPRAKTPVLDSRLRCLVVLRF